MLTLLPALPPHARSSPAFAPILLLILQLLILLRLILRHILLLLSLLLLILLPALPPHAGNTRPRFCSLFCRTRETWRSCVVK